MPLVEVVIWLFLSPLDWSFNLLTKDDHLLIEEDMMVTGPGEQRATGAGLLPHPEWILERERREREGNCTLLLSGVVIA